MPFSTSPVESVTVTLSDASELDSIISIAETKNTQISPSPCPVVLRRFSAGATRIEGNQVLFRVRGQGSPRPGFVAIAVVYGGSKTRFNCKDIEAGHLLFCGAGGEFDILANHGFEWFGLAVPVAQFEEYVAENLNVDPGKFSSQSLIMSAGETTAGLRQWWREAFTMPHDILPRGEAQLTENFLHVFCSTMASALPERRMQRKRRHSVALQAEEYLRANVGGRTSVPSLCRTLGVSRRTLESAFIEVFSLSPATYFQHLKLMEARKLLKSGPIEWGGIKVIAYDCGFTKLSDFSASYRKLFGELPSQTATRITAAFRKSQKS